MPSYDFVIYTIEQLSSFVGIYLKDLKSDIKSLLKGVQMNCFTNQLELYEWPDYFQYAACNKFDDDSDVAKLGQLQEKLITLDNENFEETRDWITESMFCQSEEGMHDMIYTFYLIAAARPHDQKSLIFSRMIASLYELRDDNELLNQIPKQCEELLVLTEDMDIEDLFQCLIDNSILEKSKCDSILQRKKQNYLFSNESTKYRDMYRHYPNFSETVLANLKIIYQRNYDGDNLVMLAIQRDDIEEFQELCSEDVSFDYNLVIKLVFRDNNIRLSLIEYAAFNGSINCFKYLLLNGAKLEQGIVRYAFYGGNIEIIRILEQNNMDLSKGIECANNCFHNEIIDWLVDTKDVKLNDLVSSENVHVLRMMSYKKCRIGISFFKTGSIILTHYFLNCLIRSKISHFVFFNSCVSGNVGLVKYLYENFNCHVSRLNDGINAFHIAVIMNRVEVVKFLSSLGGFLCNCHSKNPYGVAIENKSWEILKILANMNGILFSTSIRKKVINLNKPEIFKILFEQEWLRNKFRKMKFVDYCISFNCLNSLDAILDLKGMFDSCCSDIYILNCSKIIGMLLNKVDKLGPESFHLLKSNKFENINQFYMWLFLLCFKKEIDEDTNYRIAKYLLNHEKVQMTSQLFKKCFFKSIKRHLALSGSGKVITLLVSKFPELMKQFDEMILNYLSKDATTKLSREEIFRFLIYICEKGDHNLLLEYESILPDFINQSIDEKTLISAGSTHREIIKILLNLPEIDFQHDSDSPVEFLLSGTGSFDLLIDHPNTDFNCVGQYRGVKISLLMRIVIINDYNNFDAILKKDAIDVNFMMSVKNNSGEYFPCYSVIHYLVYDKNIDMLERLLEYPTIDINILSAQGVTPLALAIYSKEFRIINLFLIRLKGSLIDIPEDEKCFTILSDHFSELKKYYEE